MKKEKKLAFDDIPTHIRERVYSDIGEASMCWEKPGGCGIFNSQQAAEIGLKLCQFILKEMEGPGPMATQTWINDRSTGHVKRK